MDVVLQACMVSLGHEAQWAQLVRRARRVPWDGMDQRVRSGQPDQRESLERTLQVALVAWVRSVLQALLAKLSSALEVSRVPAVHKGRQVRRESEDSQDQQLRMATMAATETMEHGDSRAPLDQWADLV